jgi:hypothetical protein
VPRAEDHPVELAGRLGFEVVEPRYRSCLGKAAG